MRHRAIGKDGAWFRSGTVMSLILLLAQSPVAAQPATSSSEQQLIALLPEAVRTCLAHPDPTADQWSRQSLYVPAEDGTRLALDIFQPARLAVGARRPTLFVSTRYWRGSAGAPPGEEFRPWIDQGYAVVIADVRGTGASFGQWYIPYTLQEAKDIGHLANWIARQPWSDGKVVTTGNSYTGTTSLMSPAFGRPAIRAIIPRFSDYDMYDDLLFPGGVTAQRLLTDWGQMVRALDLNQPADGTTVRPVDGPDASASLANAIADHRQVSGGFDQAATAITYRDDAPAIFGGHRFAEGGVYQLRARIGASAVPILGWGSWMDSGIAQGMINRFIGLPNPQLSIIGAWTHGARADADPFNPVDVPLAPPPKTQRRIDRCFSQSVLNGGAMNKAFRSQILYYTMGERRWKSTSVWPVRGAVPTRFALAVNGLLSAAAPSSESKIRYRADATATTGLLNRWITQEGISDVDYGDRRREDAKLLRFDTAPLAQDSEVTGTAMIRLTITSNRSDGLFIAYLEDVAPDGRVTYVTEGELRAIHRKSAPQGSPYPTAYPARKSERADAAPLVPGKPTLLEFQLQPTSVLFRAGHRIRLAIALADKDSFLPVGIEGPEPLEIEVITGGANGSTMDLPIIRSRRR